MSISAVIPAFNEEEGVGEVVKLTKEYVDEVIVVDDNSSDDTARIAKEAGAKVISNPRNVGYIASIKKGFHEAAGDIIVNLDADGELNPRDIPLVVKPIIDGKADMVLGKRERIPRVSERILNWLTQIKVNISDSGTGLRALRKELALKLELPGKCICGILVLEAYDHGAKISEVPVSLRETSKKRKIAWFHFWQFFYILKWV